MTYLSDLSHAVVRLPLLLIFIEVICELALLLRFRAHHSGRPLHVLPNCIIMIFLLIIEGICLSSQPTGCTMPLILISAAILGAGVLIAAEAIT